jgi:hypothetical protein
MNLARFRVLLGAAGHDRKRGTEAREREREYAYLVLGARRPLRPGDGPEIWRMAAAAAGAQTSPGERESTRARGVSRERRREGRGDWN